MIAMKICYPRQEGMRFDMDYYINGHMAKSCKYAGDACPGILVEIPEEEDSKWIAVGTLFYPDMETYHTAMDQYSDELFKDIANFTDVMPEISWVEIAHCDCVKVDYNAK